MYLSRYRNASVGHHAILFLCPIHLTQCILCIDIIYPKRKELQERKEHKTSVNVQSILFVSLTCVLPQRLLPLLTPFPYFSSSSSSSSPPQGTAGQPEEKFVPMPERLLLAQPVWTTHNKNPTIKFERVI